MNANGVVRLLFIVCGIISLSVPVFAGGTKTITRGTATIINWQVGNAPNCSPDTSYPPGAGDSVASTWTNGTKNGSGSLNLPGAVQVGTFSFTCSHRDSNGQIDASDTTTLIVTDCPSGQSWNGSACIGNTPTCPAGQTWNGSACTCPSGTTWNGSSCVTPTPTGASCNTETKYWNSCQGTVYGQPHGQTWTTANTNPGVSGSATYTCNNGNWEGPTNATCGTAPVCPAKTVQWDQMTNPKVGTEKCTGTISSAAEGASASTADTTEDVTGTASYYCACGGGACPWDWSGGGITCRHRDFQEPVKADLSIVSVTPVSAQLGVSTPFTATVTNSGDGSTGTAFTNHMYAQYYAASGEGEWVHYVYGDYPSVSTKGPGESGTFTSNLAFPYKTSSAMVWTLFVCADKSSDYYYTYSSGSPHGIVHESNEGNNCTSTLVDVWEPTFMSDLAVSSVQKSDGSSELKTTPGGTVNLTATVSNRGYSATAANSYFYSHTYDYEYGYFANRYQSGAFEALFFLIADGGTYQIGAAQLRSTPLDGGQSMAISTTFQMPSEYTNGTSVRVQACADFYPSKNLWSPGIVYEENEMNNCGPMSWITVASNPAGTITATPGTCTVAAGASSCSSTIAWSTTDVSSAKVDLGSTQWATGTSGSQATTVDPSATKTFTLKQSNGTQLATVTVTAQCASQTTWNGSICASPTGTISAAPNPCIVASEASTCSTTVEWSANNTTSVSVYENSALWTTANPTGSGQRTVSPGSNKTFLLRDQYGNQLGTVTASAICTSGTSWNGSICIPPAVAGSCSTIHYGCFAGNSINNAFDTVRWTWSCQGLWGGSTDTCSETAPPPEIGSFTSTPRSLEAGGLVKITWSIYRPNTTCRITAQVQKPAVCDATCQTQRNAAQTALNTQLDTGSTNANDPYGASRLMRTAITMESPTSPTYAKGTKSVNLDYSTVFNLSCGATTIPFKSIHYVTEKNEG